MSEPINFYLWALSNFFEIPFTFFPFLVFSLSLSLSLSLKHTHTHTHSHTRTHARTHAHKSFYISLAFTLSNSDTCFFLPESRQDCARFSRSIQDFYLFPGNSPKIQEKFGRDMTKWYQMRNITKDLENSQYFYFYFFKVGGI